MAGESSTAAHHDSQTPGDDKATCKSNQSPQPAQSTPGNGGDPSCTTTPSSTIADLSEPFDILIERAVKPEEPSGRGAMPGGQAANPAPAASGEGLARLRVASTSSHPSRPRNRVEASRHQSQPSVHGLSARNTGAGTRAERRPGVSTTRGDPVPSTFRDSDLQFRRHSLAVPVPSEDVAGTQDHQYSLLSSPEAYPRPLETWHEPQHHLQVHGSSGFQHPIPENWGFGNFPRNNSVSSGTFAMASSTRGAQVPMTIAEESPGFGDYLTATGSSRRNSWQPVSDNILMGATDPFTQQWAGEANRMLPSGNRPGGAGANPILSAAISSNPGFASQPPALVPAFSAGNSQHPQAYPDGASTAPSYPGPSNYQHDRVFRPMESRAQRGCSPHEALDLMVKGFSPNYRGNPDLERNRSALIPAEANCSLFITGLSPDLTTHLLLRSIRNMGRIYATHINGPEPSRGHQTCAAKVVFFERTAAERFYERYKNTGFMVTGRPFHIGRVVWNRIRSREVDAGGRKSRVLIISGPRSIVNERSLHNYFASKIQFQVDEVITAVPSMRLGSEERALVEFRFGSYRCQAESARMALSREFKEHGVYCEFGKYSFRSVQNGD